MRKPKETVGAGSKKLWKPVSIRYFVLLNKLIRPDLVRFFPFVAPIGSASFGDGSRFGTF
jgi:hypothetical protein